MYKIPKEMWDLIETIIYENYCFWRLDISKENFEKLLTPTTSIIPITIHLDNDRGRSWSVNDFVLNQNGSLYYITGGTYGFDGDSNHFAICTINTILDSEVILSSLAQLSFKQNA